jgi:hypothetical protein
MTVSCSCLIICTKICTTAHNAIREWFFTERCHSEREGREGYSLQNMYDSGAIIEQLLFAFQSCNNGLKTIECTFQIIGEKIKQINVDSLVLVAVDLLNAAFYSCIASSIASFSALDASSKSTSFDFLEALLSFDFLIVALIGSRVSKKRPTCFS